MPSDWSFLLAQAKSETNQTIQSLPSALRTRVRQVPITFERRPGNALQQDGIERDTLGLFVGEPFYRIGTTTSPLPAQIILFLENIWEQAEANEEWYREEVHTTFLHEMGHYLGLDEDGLIERGLE